MSLDTQKPFCYLTVNDQSVGVFDFTGSLYARNRGIPTSVIVRIVYGGGKNELFRVVYNTLNVIMGAAELYRFSGSLYSTYVDSEYAYIAEYHYVSWERLYTHEMRLFHKGIVDFYTLTHTIDMPVYFYCTEEDVDTVMAYLCTLRKSIEYNANYYELDADSLNTAPSRDDSYKLYRVMYTRLSLLNL